MTPKEILDGLKSAMTDLSDEDKSIVMSGLSKLVPAKEVEVKDMEAEKKMEDMEKDYIDSMPKVKTDAVQEFKDSADFKKAMLDHANVRVSIIEKAKGYLAKEYKFVDKANTEIMADALRAEKPSEHFADNEVGVAFKMLALKTDVQVAHDHFTDSSDKWAGSDDIEMGK